MAIPSASLLLQIATRGQGSVSLPAAKTRKQPLIELPKPPIQQASQATVSAPTPPARRIQQATEQEEVRAPSASGVLSRAQQITKQDTTKAPSAPEVLSQAPERKQSAYSTPYDDLITQMATERGIDPTLARAVSYWESGGNPNARGGAGEVGLFQVIPRDMAYRYSWAASRPSAAEMATPEAQVKAGLDVLEGALRASGGDIQQALSRYNSGGPIEQAPDITRNEYIPGVMSLYQAMGGTAPTGETGFVPPEPKVPTTAPLPESVRQASSYARSGRVGHYMEWEDIKPLPLPGPEIIGPGGVPDLPAYLRQRPAPEAPPSLGIPTTQAEKALPGVSAEAPKVASIYQAVKEKPKLDLTAMPDVTLAEAVTRNASKDPELLEPPMSLLQGGIVGAAYGGMGGLPFLKPGKGGLVGGLVGALASLIAPEKVQPVVEKMSKGLWAGSNLARQVIMTPIILSATERETEELAEPVTKLEPPNTVASYWQQVKEAYGPVQIGIPVQEVVDRIKNIFTATSDEREAAWEAGRAGYTPGKAQQAYLRIMDGENPDLVVQELYEPTIVEMALESIYDPLNIVSLGLHKLGRHVANGRTLKRLATADPRTLAGLAADYAQPITRAQRWNPLRRNSESLQKRLLEESATVLNHIQADALDDAGRLHRLKVFADDPEAFARFYKQPIAASEPGKAAALLLQRMGGAEDVARTVSRAASEAVELGLEGNRYYDHISEKLLTRMTAAVDSVIPVQRTVYEQLSQPILDRITHPLNRAFSVLYLNTPGYTVRNAANNFITVLVDGVMPFERWGNIDEFERRFGRLHMAAEKGITPVGETKSKGPLHYFINLSQEVEQRFSRRATYKGTSDFMSSIWPRRVNDLVDEISPHLTPEQATTLRYRMSGALNERELVEAIAGVLGDTGTVGRTIDPDLMVRLDRMSPGLGARVRSAVNDALSPDDFARIVKADVEPALERMRAMPNDPNRPIHPDSPLGEAIREVGELAPDQQQYMEWRRRVYIPSAEGFGDARNTTWDWMNQLDNADPAIARNIRAREIALGDEYSAAWRQYWDTPEDKRPAGWGGEIYDYYTRAYQKLGDEVRQHLERLGVEPVTPRNPGARPSARTVAPERPVAGASAREEFARAAQEAGFTAKPDGTFDIGNEIHLANKLRQSGIPVEGKTLRGDLNTEQLRRATEILREAPSAPEQASRAQAARKLLELDEEYLRYADLVPPDLPEQVVDGVPVPPAVQARIADNADDFFPISQLNTDPERFQYRVAVGERGVTSKFEDVTKWSPEAAQRILVWRDPEGKVWVLDGHHRLDLARRLGLETIPVMFSSAPTEELAKAQAALVNIAAGHGTPIDAAKFFRATGLGEEALREWGVPLREPVVRQGMALANLHPSLFSAAIQGDLPIQRAILIGQELPDHDAQLALIRALDRLKRPITNDMLAELIDQVKQAPVGRERQATLFGPEELAKYHVIERTELLSHVKRELSRDKRLFGTVAGEAERLARAGNVIEIQTSQGISKEAAQLLDILDIVKNQAGPISDILNEGARRLAEGANPAQVKDEVYNAIRQKLPEVIRGGGAALTPGPSQLPLGPEVPPAQRSLFGPHETQAYLHPVPGTERGPLWEPGEGVLERPIAPAMAPPADTVKARITAAGPDSFADEATVADEIEELLGQIVEDAKRNFERKPSPGGIPNQQAWIDRAVTDLNAVKGAATFAGAEARNFALLDYSDRRAIDTMLSTFLIFPYWSSRTYPNWMVRIGTNPSIAAAFLRYQNSVRNKIEKEGLPEWLAQYVELDVPGLPEPFYVNVRSLLDPLYSLSYDFDDPVVLESTLGKIRETFGDTVGMSVHPIFTIADAAMRYLQDEPEEASRVLGHLSSHTKLIRYLTGKLGVAEGAGYTLEPWLWRGSPLVGGDHYAIMRATRQLAAMSMNGEITPTEAADAARAFSTGNFDHPLVRKALNREIEDRLLPTVSSFVLGLPARMRTPSEIEIDEFYNAQAAIWALKDEVTDEQWSALWRELYDEYPFGEILSVARKDREAADTAWVWNVMGRIPPGHRTDAFLEAGVSREILDKFWATDAESEVPRLEQLSEAERLRILSATLELAELYDVPTPTMSAEWEQVQRRQTAMYDEIERQFPGVLDLERQYYATRDQNAYQADVFLQAHPELKEMWDYRTNYRKRDPLLMWYYGPPARDQAISYIWDTYFSLREGAPRRRLVQSMGPEFEEYFMSKKYDYISDAQLFVWATYLDGLLYYTRKDMPDDWQGRAPTAEEMLVRIQQLQ